MVATNDDIINKLEEINQTLKRAFMILDSKEEIALDLQKFKQKRDETQAGG